MSENLVEVKHLQQYFPAGGMGKNKQYVQAVDDVSFAIRKGETLGLVGESGCGKTTTGRTLLRLYEPTDGTIIYDGKVLFDKKEKIAVDMLPYRRRMQIVFQDPYASLDPRMTIGDIVGEGIDIHHLCANAKERHDKIISLLERVGLNSEHANRYPHEFSGGQRQRVAIGRAIVRDPKVFLMDEPLSNLDAKLRNQMRAELIKLRHEIKGTFIYVTHDQTEAMTLGDRIVVMKDGVVQQIATPQEVFNHPANIFVAGFIGVPQMNFFDAQLVRSGNGFTVKTEDMNVALAPETCAQLALNWDGGDVKEITAGVRPEQILLADKGEEGALQGTVEVTELMGSTEHVHVTAPDGQFVLIIPVVDLEAKGALKAGDTIWFKFEKNATHLFDKVSGKNLI